MEMADLNSVLGEGDCGGGKRRYEREINTALQAGEHPGENAPALN